jgi:Flp pilus assembly pilin Flp
MLELNPYIEFIRHHVARLRTLMASDEGASVVEYGLIVSLVAAAIIALISTVGPKVAAAITSH